MAAAAEREERGSRAIKVLRAFGARRATRATKDSTGISTVVHEAPNDQVPVDSGVGTGRHGFVRSRLGKRGRVSGCDAVIATASATAATTASTTETETETATATATSTSAAVPGLEDENVLSTAIARNCNGFHGQERHVSSACSSSSLKSGPRRASPSLETNTTSTSKTCIQSGPRSLCRCSQGQRCKYSLVASNHKLVHKSVHACLRFTSINIVAQSSSSGQVLTPSSSSSLDSSQSHQVIVAGSGQGQGATHGGMGSTGPSNLGTTKSTSEHLALGPTAPATRSSLSGSTKVTTTISYTTSANTAPYAPILDVTAARRAPSPTSSHSTTGTINRASKTTDAISRDSAYTAIRDPSLDGDFQLQGHNSLETAAASSSPVTASRGSLLPTSIIITITLAIVAGLAVLAVALFCLYFRRRRRRSGPLGSAGHWHTDDTKKKSGHKSPSAVSALSALSPLSPLSPSFSLSSSPPPAPPARPPGPPARPPAPPSEASPSFSRDKSKSRNVPPDKGALTPPPRLKERKFHNSTKSETSIQLVKRYTHSRWGKPTSLSILSSSSSSTRQQVEPQPLLYRPLASVEGELFRDGGHMPARQSEASHFRPNHPPKKRLSPTSIVPSPRHLGSGTTTPPSALSINSRAAHDRNSSLTSGPRTPRQVEIPAEVMGLESPGPPPDRALPSPPSQRRQTKPLSPRPADSTMDSLRPEEIGLAIGSPSYHNMLEKSGRL
ncbi:hypothetical protein E4U21_002534 [Claviceps maximensis]|nr:hypothetical protein E4U21_002534 [Claviceps maximensis]